MGKGLGQLEKFINGKRRRFKQDAMSKINDYQQLVKQKTLEMQFKSTKMSQVIKAPLKRFKLQAFNHALTSTKIDPSEIEAQRLQHEREKEIERRRQLRQNALASFNKLKRNHIVAIVRLFNQWRTNSAKIDEAKRVLRGRYQSFAQHLREIFNKKRKGYWNVLKTRQ